MIYAANTGVESEQANIYNLLTSEEHKKIEAFNKGMSLFVESGTLGKFKDIMKNSRILGQKISYEDFLDNKKSKTIIIPRDIDKLDLSHLYMIARSSAFNALSEDKQSQLKKLLIHETCSSVITYAAQYGGYPQGNSVVKLDTNKKTILINQASIDFRDKNQLKWLQDSNGEQITGTDNATKISKTLYKDFVKKQFDLALNAAIFQSENLEDGEKIDFRFLRAGMGIFAGSFDKKLDTPRLEAIQEYLKEKLLNESFEWKKIGAITLPFEDASIPETKDQITQIHKLFNEQSIKFFSDDQDCLKPRDDFITATTDTANPLWRFSGGGVFEMINKNAYRGGCDVFLNPDILIDGKKTLEHKSTKNETETKPDGERNNRNNSNVHKKTHYKAIASIAIGVVSAVGAGFLSYKLLENSIKNMLLLAGLVCVIGMISGVLLSIGSKLVLDRVETAIGNSKRDL